MVVTASLEVLCEPPKPLNIAVLKHTGERGRGNHNNMYIYKYVGNVNKAVNDNIYTWGCIFRVKYLVD